LIANASVPTNATNLVLNKLYESVLGSSDIFITGTGLFYSPLFGYDVAMINSNPANLVTSFAVHENEMFAFSTSVKDLWIGSIDIRSSQQVIPPRSNSNLYIPFFDTHGDVFELVYDGNLNRQYQNRSTALGVTECTYSTIYFEYVAPYQSFISLSNSSIREKQESIKIKTKSLPDTLYLDFYEEFTFEMHLVPQDWSVSSLASVTFEIENSNIVTVQSVRIEDFARRTIVYRVSIIDNGMQRPEQSGLIASLRIIVSRDNLGCLATEEVGNTN
jgi:hypothetical protein